LSPANQGRFREADIRQVLAEASFVVIRREVEAAWRDTQRGKQFSTAMSPREALSAYLDQEKPDLTAAGKDKLLDWGDSLIAEVLGHGMDEGVGP
jgi:hypothetical protein